MPIDGGACTKLLMKRTKAMRKFLLISKNTNRNTHVLLFNKKTNAHVYIVQRAIYQAQEITYQAQEILKKEALKLYSCLGVHIGIGAYKIAICMVLIGTTVYKITVVMHTKLHYIQNYSMYDTYSCCIEKLKSLIKIAILSYLP
ncbi:hypothetical protein ACJX0J_008077 [Zea mays]